MKGLKQLMVIPIFAALVCTGLHAQSVDMKATIPFDFHAGDSLMPAGQYVIHAAGPVIWLRETDGSKAVRSVLMSFGIVGRGEPRGRLSFNRYGDKYFLTTIWNPFTNIGLRLPQRAREKELAKRVEAPEQVAVFVASNK